MEIKKGWSTGITVIRDKDVLNKEQYGLTKTITIREDIIVCRSDKSNACVIMDRTDYETKLSPNVGDTKKISRIWRFNWTG